jgi:hypothetical protein
MKRTEVEHVIKSAGLIANDKKVFTFVEGMLESEITSLEKIKKLILKLPRKKEIALNNLNLCRQRIRSKNDNES